MVSVPVSNNKSNNYERIYIIIVIQLMNLKWEKSNMNGEVGIAYDVSVRKSVGESPHVIPGCRWQH
jgi:hypothetical protein